VIVTLLRVECCDHAAAAEFDELTAKVFQHVSDHEPRTLVFASHRVEGSPLTRVFYEIYRDREGANIHAQAGPLRELLASQNSLVAGARIEHLNLGQAKGLLFDAD
jgi:quinol monooxygenase YgiN